MPQTRSLTEVRRFCDAITAAGGVVPDVLQHLLDGADLIDGYSAAHAPIRGIVEQLAAGKLDAKKLTALVEAAAQQQLIADFIGGLRPAVGPEVVQRFHRELKAGGADEILSSLRDRFDKAVAAITEAKSVLGSGESSLEHVLAGADESADVAGVWRSLPRHLTTVAQIAAIASQFGCRQTSMFSLVASYNLADNHLIDDRALAVTTGGLVGDSAPMMRPDRGGTTSPFYRAAGLRLWTIEEMQLRYDEFAAAEFDRTHADRPRSGKILEGGEVEYDKPPVNPFRQEELAR